MSVKIRKVGEFEVTMGDIEEAIGKLSSLAQLQHILAAVSNLPLAATEVICMSRKDDPRFAMLLRWKRESDQQQRKWTAMSESV